MNLFHKRRTKQTTNETIKPKEINIELHFNPFASCIREHCSLHCCLSEKEEMPLPHESKESL